VQPQERPSRGGSFVKLNVAAATALTALAIALSVWFMVHAGALWRDEAATLHFATQPSYGDVIQRLDIVSLPLLYPTVLRLWFSVGWPNADVAARVLGVLVSVAAFAGAWWSARLVGIGAPLVTLALFATHAATLEILGAVRPYGLGSLFVMLAFATLWRLVASPRVGRFLGAAAAATLAVQAQYQNTVLVFVLCLAAVVVAATRKSVKAVVLVLAVGATAALSLVPYVPFVLRGNEWRALHESRVTFGRLLGRLAELMAGSPVALVVLLLIILVGCYGAVRMLAGSARPDHPPVDRARVGFAALTIVVGIVLSTAFFVAEARFLQPWHVVPLLAMVAIAFDTLFAEPRWPRWTRLAVAVVVVAVALPVSVARLAIAQTNIDVIAARLERDARPGDLIVVNPWWLGITFQRYYDGGVEWITIPPIEDHRFHRYDLIRERMISTDPLRPVYTAIAHTLSSGHRVWVVGWVEFLPPGKLPVVLPPAPNAPTGWADVAYNYAWSTQVGYYVQTHAKRWELIAVPVEHISPRENPWLLVVDGWTR
jgi:hypothetical protein